MTPSFWGLSSHSHHLLRGQLGFQEGVSPQLGGFTSCSHLVRGQLGSLRVYDLLILGALLSLSPPPERPVGLSRGCKSPIGGLNLLLSSRERPIRLSESVRPPDFGGSPLTLT